MRGRVFIGAIIGMLALTGCAQSVRLYPSRETEQPTIAPSQFPSATPSPTSTTSPAPTETPSPIPTEMPSPTPTEIPSPTPTQTVGLIDFHPETLILTLEEMELEESYSVWFTEEAPNDEFLQGLATWDEIQAWSEWIETSGRIIGWRIAYASNEFGDRVTLTIEADVYWTLEGRQYAYARSAELYSTPEGVTFEHLRDLVIGEGTVLYRVSWESGTGEMMYQQSIEYSTRNIGVWITFFTIGEPASDEQLDWLVEIALLQLQKLETMPLSDEVMHFW